MPDPRGKLASRSRWHICLLAGIAAVYFGMPAEARELEDKKWIKASSENFEIYSRTSKSNTVDMLRHLEVLRNIVLAVNSTAAVTTNIPTSIVVLRGSKEYLEMGGRKGFAGVFLRGLRQNTIIMLDKTGMDEAQVVLHEYVHFLTQNSSAFTYPKWYTEGYADYLGTMNIKGDRVELLTYSMGRLNALIRYKWLPVEKLLTSQSVRDLPSKDVSLFYAQSWALVHFLSRYKEHGPNVGEGLWAYNELRLEGLGEVRAFEEAFELDAETLNDRVVNYLNKEFIAKRMSLSEILPDFEPTIIEPDPAEVAVTLGNAASVYGQKETAERFYRRATESESSKAGALAGLGRLSVRDERFDEAGAYFDQALAASPDNTEVLLDRASFYSHLAAYSEDHLLIPEYDRLAAADFAAVAAAGAVSPEYDLLFATHLSDAREEYFTALDYFESAYRKLPANRDIQSALLNAYLLTQQPQKAIAIAKVIQGWSFDSPGRMESMQKLIDSLQEYADSQEQQ